MVLSTVASRRAPPQRANDAAARVLRRAAPPQPVGHAAARRRRAATAGEAPGQRLRATPAPTLVYLRPPGWSARSRRQRRDSRASPQSAMGECRERVARRIAQPQPARVVRRRRQTLHAAAQRAEPATAPPGALSKRETLTVWQQHNHTSTGGKHDKLRTSPSAGAASSHQQLVFVGPQCKQKMFHTLQQNTRVGQHDEARKAPQQVPQTSFVEKATFVLATNTAAQRRSTFATRNANLRETAFRPSVVEVFLVRETRETRARETRKRGKLGTNPSSFSVKTKRRRCTLPLYG